MLEDIKRKRGQKDKSNTILSYYDGLENKYEEYNV
jgi:hypothetical protein